jgi:hypothetical protein
MAWLGEIYRNDVHHDWLDRPCPCREQLKARVDCWLSLAAAPTFAIMALVTGIHSDSISDMLCLAAHDASPLTGMVPMYLLMSGFHLAPWLRLLYCQRRGAGRC